MVKPVEKRVHARPRLNQKQVNQVVFLQADIWWLINEMQIWITDLESAARENLWPNR